MSTWAFIIALAIVVFCDGCSIGPFYPPHPKACLADPDCPDNAVCKYPAASARGPVCMPGTNSIYGWSPTPTPGSD